VRKNPLFTRSAFAGTLRIAGRPLVSAIVDAPEVAPAPASTSTEIEPVVINRGGKLVANSRDVADAFGKEHRNVVRDIRELIEKAGEINLLNFEQVVYTAGNGQSQPAYEMDREGFTLLVFGFEGAEALAWKRKYIAAFNAMEADHECYKSE
jgi:Rha family phage regulatory protein